MTIENNFVSVLPSVLVDPVLKLRLEQGRWSPESSARGGSIDLHLAYDPELRADRLTMPVPEMRRKVLEMLGPLERDWAVFESEASRRLVHIIVEIQDQDDEVRLEFFNSAHNFQVTAELLVREAGDRLSAAPFDVLLYMLKSVILMENWDERYAIPWGKRSISFCTNPDLAEKLTQETGEEFDRTPDGLAIIASRAVRS